MKILVLIALMSWGLIFLSSFKVQLLLQYSMVCTILIFIGLVILLAFKYIFQYFSWLLYRVLVGGIFLDCLFLLLVDSKREKLFTTFDLKAGICLISLNKYHKCFFKRIFIFYGEFFDRRGVIILFSQTAMKRLEMEVRTMPSNVILTQQRRLMEVVVPKKRCHCHTEHTHLWC